MKLLLFLSSMWVMAVYLWAGIQRNVSSHSGKHQKSTSIQFDEEVNPLNPIFIFKY